MNSEQAFEKQVEMYRRMTGEERLAIGLRLHELSCDMRAKGYVINIRTLMQVKWSVCSKNDCASRISGDRERITR